MKSVTNWFKGLSSSNHRGAERRKSPLLVAHYWDGGVPMAHDIQNISSTGFYLVTTERWHPGTVVTMTLQRTDIPDANASSEGYITVLSKVIRMGEDGVGFEFIPQPESSGQAESRTGESAGKKALGRFIERLKSEQGHVIIGFTAENTAENQEMNVIGPGCKFGNAWRERYEKTY